MIQISRENSVLWLSAAYFSVASLSPAFADEQNAVTTGPLFAAFGDSISTGFDASHPLNNFHYSWSTGSNITSNFKSQADYVKEATGIEFERKNYAVVGAKASDIRRQIDKLGDKIPQLATLLIGANDVCGWRPDFDDARDLFEADVRHSLDMLVAKNPNIRILMSAVPNVGRLYELGATHGCQVKWNVTGFCSPLLGGERTPQERQAFLTRLDALNDTLAHIATSYPQVKYHGEVAQIQFEWEHVSRIDCFHPSVQGQGFLSEALWDGSWHAE